MKQFIKRYANKVVETITNRTTQKIIDNSSLADNVAYRVVLETMFKELPIEKKPNELFSSITDGFWLWLNTEGRRKHKLLQTILPGVPAENVQVMFTGNSGDVTLRDAFTSYKAFRELYEQYIGPIGDCKSILDYGCGWGRIIRFFMKDLEPSRIWGCDPVAEMIEICKTHNKWCNFEKINFSPPTSFQDNTFELIYSFSVFSHLSEEMHNRILTELHRILKPGGLLLITTRTRDFFDFSAQMRKRKDLHTLNPGPQSAAYAFMDTKQAQTDYDNGKYCHTKLGDGEWSYWGETAIPKEYVLKNWTKQFTFLDFIDDRQRCIQNIIVVQKPLND